MTFADFQPFRERLLRERPGVVDCSATNLYAALAHLIPPASPLPREIVHRCHLAAEWAQCFGLSPETACRALVSRGVRDSLAVLFHHYAGERARLWIPTDNYPVYGELARAAGLALLTYTTLPEPVWPEATPVSNPELLLITNPLKPLGRWLTAQDVATLTAWLASSSHRRLIIDAVYTFETDFHESTRTLLRTGQTILLHSLTKGWLHPRLFGVAVVPEPDAAVLTPVFRDHPPEQTNLARARELMGKHADMPESVAREIAAANNTLLARLPAASRAAMPPAVGYFMPLSVRWSNLLAESNVLGIPASAFGSDREDLTILSSLSFIS